MKHGELEPQTIIFNVEAPETFPIIPVAAGIIIAVVFFGLLLLRRHRKTANSKQ